MATYVISDLHGQYKMLEKLLEKAAFSAEDKLYVIGDAIDRGPDGIKILQLIMNTPNMELLLGNHEFMMLNSVALDGSASNDYHKLPGRNADSWIHRNGGNKTYFRYRRLKIEQRLELLEWLSTRSLSTLVEVNGVSYVLTHSYFDKDKFDVQYKDIDYQEVRNIVWNTPFRRDLYVPESDYVAYAPWKFVVGHVPVCRVLAERDGVENHELAPYMVDNIIDIDGCCGYHAAKNKLYRGGILLRLDDMTAITCSFAELEQ